MLFMLSAEPRQYELLSSIDQDGWSVEIRRRLKGKCAGNLYKVFRDPKGVQKHSLKQAMKAGYVDTDNRLKALMDKVTAQLK